MLRKIRAFLVTLFVVTALTGGTAVPGHAQLYPRLGLYGSVTGGGAPLVNTDGTLNATALDQVARYDEVIFDVNPLTPYRPDIIAGLRQRHPGIHILAYILAHDIWDANDADSLHAFPTLFNHMVRNLGGFLYNQVDGQKYPGADVNLARRDGTGRYTVAEGIADLVQNQVLATGQWDGVFFDVYCESITWTEDATHKIDYSSAGYASLAAFDVGWRAGADTLANRLRRIAGPTPILVGNCATSSHLNVFNGWMRENFPFQNGGTWYSNMTLDPLGYFSDDADAVQPSHDYIFSAMQGADGAQYSSTNARKVRFGLGSAALGEGYGVFGPSDRNVLSAPYQSYWYDEYAVDLTTGHTATDLAHTHWLGAALGPHYQMIWAGTNPDAVTNPGFETSVTSGWTLGHFAPAAATMALDTTTAAVGKGSVHVSVTAVNGTDWYVNLTSSGTITVFPGNSYAVTFWAKASSPRFLPVTATIAGGGAAANSIVQIGTTWQQYQVILLPSLVANTSLEFFLGTQVGEVWLDDVHFQQGATNLYRRDFANGTVLVNPSDTPLQVPMPAGYRRILGTVDPVTNDGSVATSVIVMPSDALFLINASPDHTPPAAVTDMRITP